MTGRYESGGVMVSRKPLEKHGFPDLEVVSNDLVLIRSIFEQLTGEYLTADEKAAFGLTLARCYRNIKRGAMRIVDVEARLRLRRYLRALGGVGVQSELFAARGREGRPFTLLRAVREAEVVLWIYHFYSAIHQIDEPHASGERIGFTIVAGSLERYRRESASVMHWFDSLS
jgi:hypothetical protein